MKCRNKLNSLLILIIKLTNLTKKLLMTIPIWLKIIKILETISIRNSKIKSPLINTNLKTKWTSILLTSINLFKIEIKLNKPLIRENLYLSIFQKPLNIYIPKIIILNNRILSTLTKNFTINYILFRKKWIKLETKNEKTKYIFIIILILTH
jgi:hypothetical protein